MNGQRRPPPTDFDSVVDFCLREIRAGRLAAEYCLNLYPDAADRLRPILLAAANLDRASSLSAIRMRPAARDALALRLRAQLSHMPSPRAPRSPVSRRGLWRWVPVAAAFALALMMVGGGVVAASGNAVPGDALYPVKRWSESIAVQSASGEQRASRYLDLAQRRLDEFDTLAQRGVIDTAVLNEVAAETQNAIAIAAALDPAQRSRALERAAGLQSAAISVVSAVRAHAPEAARDGLDRALAAMMATLDETRSDVRDAATATPAKRASSTPSVSASATSTPRPSGSATVALPSTPVPGAPGNGSTRTPPGQGTPGGGLTQTPRPTQAPRPTPPGHGTPGGGLTKTLSGQGTPGGPPNTPPGQGTPGGPPNTPPGQGPKPTKDRP